MNVAAVVRATRGKLVDGSASATIVPARIVSDTRLLRRGDFFVAIAGANFDGADFIGQALAAGACGAMSMRSLRAYRGNGHILIEVADTTRALGDIARTIRHEAGVPVVGITGSNGKTTVKEMIAAVLGTSYRVLKNEGTKNNHIGVPQTLLQLTPHHEYAVLELGTNHPGEIRYLASIARPDIALITNIGPSHLAFFGDLRGVFRAKREILDGMPSRGGVLILNGDDPYLRTLRSRRVVVHTFGQGLHNDLRATDIHITKGMMTFSVPRHGVFALRLLGTHNVYNALAAISVGRACGVPVAQIRRALRAYVPSYLRLAVERVRGITIINDAYNSNPLSMSAAVQALGAYPARARWVVSGDMLELGRDERRMHRQLGATLGQGSIDGLITYGPLSRYTAHQARMAGMDPARIWHCACHADIARILKRSTQRGDAILIKGSRAMRMEMVAQKFKGKG